MALCATPIEMHRLGLPSSASLFSSCCLRRSDLSQQESTSRRDFYAALGAAIQLAGEFIRLKITFECTAVMIVIQFYETLSTVSTLSVLSPLDSPQTSESRSQTTNYACQDADSARNNAFCASFTFNLGRYSSARVPHIDFAHKRRLLYCMIICAAHCCLIRFDAPSGCRVTIESRGTATCLARKTQ